MKNHFLSFRFFVFLLLTLISCSQANCQLDSIHWIPPMHVRHGYEIDHFLYLSTPEQSPFPVTISYLSRKTSPPYWVFRDSVIWISNTTPIEFELGNESSTSPTDYLFSPVHAKGNELNNVLSNRGITLKGSRNFLVSYRAIQTFHAGSLTSKGRAGAGKVFRLGHMQTDRAAVAHCHFAGIMATQNNTTVTISKFPPGTKIRNGSGGDFTPTQPIVFNLNAGESYVLSIYPQGANNFQGFWGTLVEATQPIVINTGSWLHSFGSAGGDIGIDQIAPLENVGTEYILTKGQGVSPTVLNIETPIVVAHFDDTKIFVNGSAVPIATLNAGQYFVIEGTNYGFNSGSYGNMYVKTSKPTFVYQSVAGADSDITGALNFIPPINCQITSRIDNLPFINKIGGEKFDETTLILITAKNSSPIVKRNGVNINLTTGPLSVPGNPDYEVYRVESISGNVSVESNGPVQVNLLGRDGASAWGGYFSGFKKEKFPKVSIVSNGFCADTLFLKKTNINGGVKWYINGQLLSVSNDSILPVNQSGIYTAVGKYLTFCGGEIYDTVEYVVQTLSSPKYHIMVKDPLCNGGYGALYCIPDSTTSGNYSYLWSNGANTPTLQNQPAGIYTVTVTVPGGCSKIKTAAITQPPEKSIIGINNTLKCPGQSITLFPAGDFISYEWSNGTHIAENTVVNAGTYTVTATDSDGCTVIRSVQVADRPEPQAQISGTTYVCPGQTANLQPTTSFTKYEWSTGYSNPSIIVGAGSFTVTVTDDNGCTSTAEHTVEQKTAPQVSLSAGDATLCGTNDSLLIHATAPTASSISFDNGPGTTLNEVTVKSGGLYSVVVTDPFGCTNSDTILIRQSFDPHPTINGNHNFCEGGQTVLSGPAGFPSYLWSTGMNSPEITVDSSVALTLTVTDTLDCHWLTSVVQITEHPKPAPKLAGSTYVCPGDTKSLEPTAPFAKYEWSTGSTNSSIVVGAGSFTVTVTDGNGCTNTAEQTIEQKSAPLLTLSAGNATLCGTNDSRTIKPTSPTGVLYSLNGGPGTTSNEFTVSSGGLYSVVVTDPFGCTNSDTVLIRQSFDPQASISGIRDFCEKFKDTLSGPPGFAAYLWSNGATTQQTIVSTTTLLTLTVTDTLGCQWQTPPVQITEHPNPLAKITGESQACHGGTKLLTAEPSGLQYLWSNGATTVSQNLPPGAYSVTVTDATTVSSGCIGVAAFTLGEIPLRTVSLTAATPLVCYKAMARIEARVSNTDTTGTANFSETFGQTNQTTFAQGVATWEFAPTAASTVRLDALQILGYDCPFLGLPAEVSVEVDKVLAQAMPVSRANGHPISCNFGADGKINVLPMSGVAPFHYQWNPAVSSSSTAENLSAGTYTVTVTDAHGCTATAEPTLTEPAPFLPEVAGLAPLCHGINDGIISVDKTNGGQGNVLSQINNALSWAAPGEATGLPPGIYHVRLTDDLNCIFDTTIYFLEPPVYFFSLPDLPVDLLLGDDYRILVTTNVPNVNTNGVWTPATGIIDSSRVDAIVVSPIEDTWYTLHVTTPGNCPLPPASVLVRVKNTKAVFIPNAISPNGDGENDYFMVFVKSSAVKSIRSISVTDRWGELVFQKLNLPPDNNALQGWDGTFRGKSCLPGVYAYMVEVELTDGTVERYSGNVTIVP